MRVLDIINAPWAIIPSKLQEIAAIYRNWAANVEPDIAAIEARIGKPLATKPRRYTIEDGIAVIPMEGVIAKRLNMLTNISGGVSTELLASDFQSALDDPEVKAILLRIDSPGGTVDGTQKMAQRIYAARGQKPIVAVASGLMASAAYWIGSAADEVYIEDGTTYVGSIGVVGTHVDYSRFYDQAGMTVTEITAGKYKRIASEYAPLSDEGRSVIQQELDDIYALFVDAIADHRGSDVDTVLERMADGRIFIGKKAVNAGLADGIKTYERVLADMRMQFTGKAAKPRQEVTTVMDEITLETIETTHPDITKALLERGRQEGVESERARMKAVADVADGFPGHEALVNEMLFDGKTTGEQAAAKILAAERAARATVMTNIQTLSPTPAAASLPEQPRVSAADVDPNDNDAMKAAWDADAKLQEQYGSFEGWVAYRRAEAIGKVGTGIKR